MSNTNNPHYALVVNGARNIAKGERELNDYYATEPKAVELLLEKEEFSHYILEPACGEGQISEVLKSKGYDVLSTDLIDRGYGVQADFFDIKEWDGDIVTNPPYKCAKEFVLHALDIVPNGNKIAMFLKIQFLESKGRRALFDSNPPKVVYVSSARLHCAINGDFENMAGNAMCYCWYVWEKGYKGDTILRWIN